MPKNKEALKREAFEQLAKLHRKAVAKAVPTIKQALATLQKLRSQIKSAKTYNELRQIILAAEALKVLLGEILVVKHEAEVVVLLANKHVGVEIERSVPKAAGRPSKIITRTGKNKLGRSAIGIPGTSRARIAKLAELEDDDIESRAKELQAAGKDATVRALVSELKEAEIKKSRADYQKRADRGGTMATLEDLAKEGKKFSVFYADAPWEFKVYSGKGKQRSAERHYDTKSIDKIKALSPLIAPLMEKDCALFFWCVMPELSGALEVIKAWGFEHKTTAFVWVKQNRNGKGLFTGMGYWTRANAEMVLFATKGSPTRIAKDVHQIIMAPVGRHSEKPEETATRIERLLNGPYLELYGRKPRPGWTVWGNEVESLKEAAE